MRNQQVQRNRDQSRCLFRASVEGAFRGESLEFSQWHFHCALVELRKDRLQRQGNRNLGWGLIGHQFFNRVREPVQNFFQWQRHCFIRGCNHWLQIQSFQCRRDFLGWHWAGLGRFLHPGWRYGDGSGFYRRRDG